MSNFYNIQAKLHRFIIKYYKNELIKGLILFCSFGLLYFIFILFIESIFWLQPFARTLLFWVFILVELFFLAKYILHPITKLIGLQKGISLEDAATLIGKHFKEVDDKLLNVLQLQQENNQSDLLVASIEQKSKNLEPIPFKKAIDFSSNRKYLKYLAIPLFIWLIGFIYGQDVLFSDSLDRVVHHQKKYEKPAPFSFLIKNTSLDVVEGKNITIEVDVNGKVIPSAINIHFNNQSYLMVHKELGSFTYTFSSVVSSQSFYLESNSVRSKEYQIRVIPAPVITNFEMYLSYPSYTQKKNEFIKNTGNATVPQGTIITWKIEGKNTEQVNFYSKDSSLFTLKEPTFFEFKKQILNKIDYKITTSNTQLQHYESLNYRVDVVFDDYPTIKIKSDIDSISRGSVQFIGQLADDYGLDKLELVVYDKDKPSVLNRLNIPIQQLNFEQFYYVFPKGIALRDGIEYELYFEVFDNDAVNGKKSTRSKLFRYYKKTEDELKNQILEEQKESISDLEKSIKKNKEVKEDFKKLQKELQNKSEMNWNDQKKMNEFIQRQEQYENMMQRQTDEINKNLKEQAKSKNQSVENKKEEIQKRLQETKELAKQEKLREELKELAEKLNKEELTKKLKKLTENNRQNERNLERILELTKRFYVEQKANQIQEKLEKLSKKQEKLSNEAINTSEKQKELNQKFEEIKKELKTLNKDNKDLQKPMNLPKTDEEEKEVDKEQQEATEDLKESENKENSSSEKKKSASKKQKMAAQKMKQMSQKMKSAMSAMQGESMSEDIVMLRTILENLLAFSFQQEDLMQGFSGIDNTHPDFSNKLKRQYLLKEYFEHIDDSLYTLSMRQPKIGTNIFKDLSDVHYYLDESLDHFSDNNLEVGVSDQQFIMTASNNIAFLLSNILESMQNANPSMGKGQGDSFSLPDIIQKQEDAIGKMEDGIKKGQKKGEKDEHKKGEGGKQQGESEQMNGELYEIYKEQMVLRTLLEKALSDKNGIKNEVGKNALKQMEQLANDLLEKGFTNEALQKMLQLKHQLLKLKEAAYKQGIDTKREANTNNKSYENRDIKELDSTKLWFYQNEILNRQSLPLRSQYKKKVQEYFKEK